MKASITCIILTVLALTSTFVRADSAIGGMFQSEMAGSSCWSMQVVVGQQDIDRNILELITIPYMTCYSVLSKGYIGTTETAPIDAFRVDCKNKTFAQKSKAKVQHEFDAYFVGAGPKYEGKDVRKGFMDGEYLIDSDMIELFQEACN